MLWVLTVQMRHDAGKVKRPARELFSAATRPGQEIMKLHGDLHDFYAVERAYSHRFRRLRSSASAIFVRCEQGVHFRNPIAAIDFPRPEKSMEIEVRSPVRYRDDL